jgi:hypothetical protein
VGVRVITDGQLAVFFMNTDNYQRFPRGFRALFQGQVDRQLYFQVTIPAPGNYYVVLMNGSKEESRAATVTVTASAEKQRDAQATLEHFQDELDRLFVFQRFPVRIERCGKPMAFGRREGISLCEEYARIVLGIVKDRIKARDILQFVLFHQLGHVLMDQWQLPGSDDEEMADEFATVILAILGQRDRVRSMGELFSRDPSLAKALRGTLLDDHSSFSDKRVQEILRWVEDSNLARKWQAILISHMETAVLERMQRQPPSWVDLELLKKELATRR